MGKIFAIGDIHGCLSKLEALITRIEIDRCNDTLVFIGDYIDRGPDSKGVIEFVLDLRERFGTVVCLKGNHEEMFLNYVCHGTDKDLYLLNGGDTTIASYGYREIPEGVQIDVPETHMSFFKSLLLWYETAQYIFVHAGLRDRIPLEDQDSRDLLWIRYEFIHSSCDFGKTVVFGHTPTSHAEPLFLPGRIGIDTGAVYGGPLTCVELPTQRVYQA